jgi:hypothetical protein
LYGSCIGAGRKGVVLLTAWAYGVRASAVVPSAKKLASESEALAGPGTSPAPRCTPRARKYRRAARLGKPRFL